MNGKLCTILEIVSIDKKVSGHSCNLLSIGGAFRTTELTITKWQSSLKSSMVKCDYLFCHESCVLPSSVSMEMDPGGAVNAHVKKELVGLISGDWIFSLPSLP